LGGVFASKDGRDRSTASVFKVALTELGKPLPRDFPVLRNVVVAPDRATAIREVGPAIAESYKIFGNWGLLHRSDRR
jgi:hypothetical protein